jgi:hypothetical protein
VLRGRNLVVHFHNHIPGIRIRNLHGDCATGWLRVFFPIEFENEIEVILMKMNPPIRSFLDQDSLAGELAFRLVQFPFADIGGVSGICRGAKDSECEN